MNTIILLNNIYTFVYLIPQVCKHDQIYILFVLFLHAFNHIVHHSLISKQKLISYNFLQTYCKIWT